MTTMNPVIKKWKLNKAGFHPLFIRLRNSGEYEIKNKTDYYGQEYWEKIDLPIEIIERDIKEFGYEV